jgi:hypothetical protein
VVDGPCERHFRKWHVNRRGRDEFDFDYDQYGRDSNDEHRIRDDIGKPDYRGIDHFNLDRREWQPGDNDDRFDILEPAWSGNTIHRFERDARLEHFDADFFKLNAHDVEHLDERDGIKSGKLGRDLEPDRFDE